AVCTSLFSCFVISSLGTFVIDGTLVSVGTPLFSSGVASSVGTIWTIGTFVSVGTLVSVGTSLFLMGLVVRLACSRAVYCPRAGDAISPACRRRGSILRTFL